MHLQAVLFIHELSDVRVQSMLWRQKRQGYEWYILALYYTIADTSESGDVNVKLRDKQSQGCDVRVQEIQYKISVQVVRSGLRFASGDDAYSNSKKFLVCEYVGLSFAKSENNGESEDLRIHPRTNCSTNMTAEEKILFFLRTNIRNKFGLDKL